MNWTPQRQSAAQHNAQDDQPHGLIETIVSVVKHVQEDHERHEQLRHAHELEDALHLAEHKPEAEREDLPF